ncbi:MAG: hypothetical protein ACRC10_12235 [Thermoguttaceae bacterium]
MNPVQQEIDVLAPFEIWEVPLDRATIKFHRPLVLEVMLLPDDPEEPDPNEYYSVQCPELNISTWADNREDLFDFILSDIRFAWKQIVRAPESPDRKTRQIKNNYLAIAEEVDDGTCQDGTRN